jgi:predicted DNA-binding protein
MAIEMVSKPKKTARRLVALPPELDDRLRNICDIAGLSINSALNQMIEQYVDELENKILDEASKG